MSPRPPLLRRPWAAGLLLWALAALISPGLARAGDGRLLTTEAAEVLEHPVLGLQRTALPLFGGIAVDTSLYADILLAPNLGLRWALAAGPHRFVVGARYTQFVGAPVYESIVKGQSSAVTRFDAEFSGPSAYAAYGLSLGSVLIQGEARYGHYKTDYASVTGSVALNVAGNWWLIGELGTRFSGGASLKAAAGIRYGGENLGLALGASYAGLEDPMLPNNGSVNVLPVLDVSWTFQ